MRRDELIEMMSIWINTTTLSNDTKAHSCADVAEIYHAEQLRLLSVVKLLSTEEEIISEISDKHNKMVDKQIEDFLNAPATGNKLTGFFN